MVKQWRSFWRDEEGQALSEYAVIIMVVGLAAIGILVAFGDKIKAWFDKFIACAEGDKTLCP